MDEIRGAAAPPADARAAVSDWLSKRVANASEPMTVTRT
jgi:hypothetical protein